ncbi:MAG: HEAT repeat domain-containing protein [Promethearchaeota archaeon]
MSKLNSQPLEIYKKRKELGLENSKNLLSEIIETNKSNNIRQEAIKYLGLISSDSPSLKKECFDIFENLLITDEGIEIKCEAAKAIGKINFEKGLKPLRWVLEQDSVNHNVKLSTLKAIKKIKFEDSEIQLFINELDSRYPSIRQFVKDELLSLTPELLINRLVTSLRKKKYSEEHKIEILKLIGHDLSSINIAFKNISYLKTKYPEIVDELIQNKALILDIVTLILNQEDSELMECVITIFKILGKDVNRDLIKLLLVDDFIVKKNAIILSGKLKLKEAVDFLTSNLDDIYSEVTIASIIALGEIGDISAVPELLDILNIEDISFEYTDLDLKWFIIEAIKKIYINNRKVSYDYLYSHLSSDNITIKENIPIILGEIGKDEFVEPLINLLKIKNLDVKKNAIIALGKIGSIKPLENLIEVLDDSDAYWLIKKVAADAIYHVFQKNWYKIKDEDNELRRLLSKDIAMLSEYLRNNDTENFKVKLSLIKFLETFGEESALSALLKRVNDFHRIVRIHASNAIKKIEEKLEESQDLMDS